MSDAWWNNCRMDVEAKAVSDVTGAISLCPLLKPHINSGDTILLTDGHIEVYGKLPKNKKNWDGRVTVQVKGRGVPGLEGAPTTRSIEKVDLEGFLKDSGVLYFVVNIDESTGDSQILFNNLAPFKIAHLLDTMKERKTSSITVELEPLPKDRDKIQGILRHALETRDQKPQNGLDPALVEQVESMTFSAPSGLNLDGPVKFDLSKDDVNVVMRTASGMTFPFSGIVSITPEVYSKQPTDMQVSSGAVTYTNVYRKRIDDKRLELTLDDAIVLEFEEKGTKHAVTTHPLPNPSLRERRRALDFMESFATTGDMRISGKPIFPPGSLPTGSDKELEQNQRGLRQLQETLEALSIDIDLVDMNEVKVDQKPAMDNLHRALVEGKTLKLESAMKGFAWPSLGTWQILAYVMETDEDGTYRIADPFDPEVRGHYWARKNESDEQRFPVTVYEFIERSQLASVLNLNLDSVVDTYEAIADGSETFSLANHRVLDFLYAADTDDRRREAFLDAAMALNDWLIGKEGPELHHRVNRWQILHRQGRLSDDDRAELRELKHEMAVKPDDDVARQTEIACAILLDERDEVDFLIGRLPEKPLQELQPWPIMNLKTW